MALTTVVLLSLLLWQQVSGGLEADARRLRMRRQLEMDRIRLQILQEIGKEGLPEPMPLPPKEALEMMIKMSAEKAVPRADADLMILPMGGHLDCNWSTVSPCSRFEYNLSSNVIPSTAKWMIHKSEFFSSENLTVSVSCEERKMVQLERTDEGKDWLVYSFSELQNLTSWKERTKCEIEISGLLLNEQPLLMVEEEKRIRKRQTAAGCDVIPFSISFREIGLEKWIVHPQSFEAKFCEGPCESVQGHYEYLMSLFFGKDETLEDRYGRCWATCCRPREYESINLIHVEDDNTFAHRIMTNMIVKSCSCS